MKTNVSTPPLPGQLEYLIPGCNALETSLVLGQSWTRAGMPYMLIDTVKRVQRTLDEQNVLKSTQSSGNFFSRIVRHSRR